MKETECGVMFRNKDKHYLSYKDKYFKRLWLWNQFWIEYLLLSMLLIAKKANISHNTLSIVTGFIWAQYSLKITLTTF